MDAPINEILYGIAAWRTVMGDKTVRAPEDTAAMAAHLERMADNG